MLSVLLSPAISIAEEPGPTVPGVHRDDLAGKLGSLKEEQAYLLFLKTFYGSDSKYLIIDRQAGKGVLMYRSRVFRTFGWEPSGKGVSSLRRGIHIVSQRVDGSPLKREIHFGNELSLQAKRKERKRTQQRVILDLDKKDLAAIYYALETGGMVYIK